MANVPPNVPKNPATPKMSFWDQNFLGLGIATNKVAIMWIMIVIVLFMILGALMGGGEGGFLRISNGKVRWRLRKLSIPGPGGVQERLEAAGLLFAVGPGKDRLELLYNTSIDPNHNYDEIELKAATEAEILALEKVFGVDLLDKPTPVPVAGGNVNG